jgi:hypothetical protein
LISQRKIQNTANIKLVASPATDLRNICTQLRVASHNCTIYWTSHYITKYFDKEILLDAMGTLYNVGVTGKLYRLWFMLNKSAFGISDLAPTGENVVQGVGGLISALNLRKPMTA